MLLLRVAKVMYVFVLAECAHAVLFGLHPSAVDVCRGVGSMCMVSDT
jgi:hypothetical protein